MAMKFIDRYLVVAIMSLWRNMPNRRLEFKKDVLPTQKKHATEYANDNITNRLEL